MAALVDTATDMQRLLSDASIQSDLCRLRTLCDAAERAACAAADADNFSERWTDNRDDDVSLPPHDAGGLSGFEVAILVLQADAEADAAKRAARECARIVKQSMTVRMRAMHQVEEYCDGIGGEIEAFITAACWRQPSTHFDLWTGVDA